MYYKLLVEYVQRRLFEWIYVNDMKGTSGVAFKH